MAFHLTHGCNLKCRLCFAGKGLFGGPFARMEEDTALRSLEFLVRNSGDRRRLVLTFTGGEPLLNLPVLKALVRRAGELGAREGKEFQFVLFTNGLALGDESIRYLSGINPMAINISLDGPREIHDGNRPRSNGGGSFEGILENIRKVNSSPWDRDCA